MKGNTKIVIADDMEPILLYLENVISKHSCFELVGSAKNGKELIDIVIKKDPDIIITDIEMPECGGLQAIEKLNEQNIHKEYVLITGNNNFVIDSNMKALGIVKVIKKPILDDKTFIKQIESIVNKDSKRKISEPNFETTSNIKNNNIIKENIIERIIKKIFQSK